MFKKPALNFSESSGQSLVEVLIALAVTALVILALVVISLMGLKNAQFAQNQVKVTKYAQEAIDQIKSIRNRNGTVNFTFSSGTTVVFSDLWNRGMSADCGGPCYLRLNSGTSLSGAFNDPSVIDNIGDGFLRQITFEDASPLNSTYEKRVTVKIKWKDGKGEHESNIQTILTKY